MKIFLLDRDNNYVERLSEFMHLFSSEMHIICFDDLAKLEDYMNTHDCDLLLCAVLDDETICSIQKLCPPRLPFAWMADKQIQIDSHRTILKYQSIPKIYETFCEIYEQTYHHTLHRVENALLTKESNDIETKIIAFFPVHGGAGSTVMAKSCAYHLAKTDSVLYLNLETFPSDLGFSSENQGSFSEVIAEMRGRYTDETLKKVIWMNLPSDKTYEGRLKYFPVCRNAMDLNALRKADIIKILNIIKAEKKFSYIIVDADMSVSERTAGIIDVADKLVFTTNDTQEAMEKMRKIQRYIHVLEREGTHDPAPEYLIYNQYFSVDCLKEYTNGMTVIGRFPRMKLKDNQPISEETVIQNICRTPDLFQALQS